LFAAFWQAGLILAGVFYSAQILAQEKRKRNQNNEKTASQYSDPF